MLSISEGGMLMEQSNFCPCTMGVMIPAEYPTLNRPCITFWPCWETNKYLSHYVNSFGDLRIRLLIHTWLPNIIYRDKQNIWYGEKLEIYLSKEMVPCGM